MTVEPVLSRYADKLHPVSAAGEVLPAAGLSLDDFLAAAGTEQRMLFRGVPAAAMSVWAGEPRSLKTMAALQTMVANAGAHAFLTRDAECAGGSVYVSEEGSASALAERLAGMRRGLPVDSERLRILHRQGVTLTDATSWELVRRAVEDVQATLVVLDTFAALMDGDENSVRDVRDSLRPIQRLIADHGCAVILIHHTNKHGEGRPGKRMRGSSALWGACDAIWSFARDGDNGLPLNAGRIAIEPKDGDLEVVRFTWDRDSWLMDLEDRPACSPDGIRDAAERLIARGEVATAEALRTVFLPVGRSWFAERLAATVQAGLLEIDGKGRATRYVLPDRTIRPDGSIFGGPDE